MKPVMFDINIHSPDVVSVVEWFVCSAAVREGTGSNPASDLV